MTQLTVPDSWGSSLLESNDCHEPGGQPTGGRFCSGPSMQRTFVTEGLGEEVAQTVAGIARELKFPADRITVKSQDESYHFTLGDEHLTAAATYNTETDQINLYSVATTTMPPPLVRPPGYNYAVRGTPDPKLFTVELYRGSTITGERIGTHEVRGNQTDAVNFAIHRLMGIVDPASQRSIIGINKPVLASILAHEVQHHRWNTVMQQYDKELAAITDYDNRMHVEYKHLPYYEQLRHQLTDSASFLREEHKATYPTVAALQEFFIGDTLRSRLVKEDGISDYSRQWWKAWETGSGVNYRQVYNEVQAEVAAYTVSKKYGRKIEAPKPAWRKFYYAINREYTRLRREQRRTRHAA